MKKYFMALGAIVFFAVIFSIPVFAYSISGQAKFQNVWEKNPAFWDRAAFLFSSLKVGQNKDGAVAKVTRPVVVEEPEWSQQLNSMRAFATSA